MPKIGFAMFVALCASAFAARGAQAEPESISPGEAETIAKVVTVIEGAIRGAYAAGARPARRDAHAKGHGCVAASLKVRDDLPEPLRQGIFATPITYPAIVRFSNSAGSPHSDLEGDGRGMAIKVLGVEGEKLLPEEKNEKTQDFVMINHEVFFIRNVADYLPFVQMVLAGKIEEFFAAHRREGEIFAAFNATPAGNVLRQRFYSGSPYRLGPAAIKFSAIPVDCTTRSRLTDDGVHSSDPDYLRKGLAAWLAEKDACFDFAVQPQRDSEKQPIEDATIAWDEHAAPFVTVASMRIPRQTFDTPARQMFCENLSYTPWHSLAAHRPVGGINRMRRAVYMAISKLRHGLNGASRTEPKGQTFR